PQVQRVGQEPKRPADAEFSAAKVVSGTAPRAGLPAGTFTRGSAFAAAAVPARVLPPPHRAWMHRSSNSPGPFAPGGDFGRGHHASRRPLNLTSAPATSTPRRAIGFSPVRSFCWRRRSLSAGGPPMMAVLLLLAAANVPRIDVAFAL